MNSMKLSQIEERASQIHDVLKKSFPGLKDADLAALAGYYSAYVLNSAMAHPVFRTFGGVCYDILTTQNANETEHSEIQGIPSSLGEDSGSSSEVGRVSIEDPDTPPEASL